MQLQPALFVESPEEIFARVFAEYRPRTPLESVQVVFKRYANANSGIAWTPAHLRVRLSDMYQGAPAPVVEALAHILVAKLFRRQAPAPARALYRRWLNRKEVRHTMQVVKQARGRKYVSGSGGAVYDLEPMFEAINQKYFGGLMARPDLGWSRRVSRSLLGHYDPSHHAIILSKLLDHASVPGLVVEYVLYHEMLHLKHPVEHKGTRRCVHTRAFREEERRFEGLAEAKDLLKRICSMPLSHY